MPTIKDIAKAAGVSHGTVSNVLNKTGKVSAQKIRLVEDAARRLGYVPNTQAQMLRQGAPNNIAVIIPSLRDDRYRDLFLSVQSGLSAQGLGVLVYNTDDIAAKEELVLDKLPVSNLAGVVSVSCLGAGAAAYRELPCPVVAVNRSIDAEQDRALVTFDHYQAGCDIGRYILEQGWRHIAFFCTAGKQPDESGVFAGMTDVLENASVSTQKFSCDTQLIINKAFDILHDDHPYDAVVTTDNLRCRAVAVAAGFLDASNQPQIVSLGASQTFSDPFVKTYEMDYGQMGARIVEILLARIHEKKPLPRETTLPPKGFSFRFPALKAKWKGQLRLLTLESPSTAALGKIIPMFRRLTGLELKITSMSYNDLYDHLALINKNFYYDLIRIDAAWLESMGSRLYRPVEELGMADESLTRNLVSDSSGKYCISDGVRCALPFDPSVQIFLYRSDLFEDATLRRLYYERYREQLTVPDTMERYAHVAEFFTRSCTPDSPTLYGTTITNGGAETAACDFLPYYLAEGGAVCDEQGRVRMDTPEMHTALERYRQMQRYASGDESVWWRDSVRQFADGTAATAHTFSNHAAYIINSKRSNVVGKTGVAVMPGGRPLLGGGVLGTCKYSGKLEACKAFFEWFYTKDIASAMVRLGGTSPLIESYNNYENFSVFPWLSVARDSFAIGVRGSVYTNPNGFSNRRYEYALGTAVRNVLNRSMTSAEAVRFAQTMYDSMDADGRSYSKGNYNPE